MHSYLPKLQTPFALLLKHHLSHNKQLVCTLKQSKVTGWGARTWTPESKGHRPSKKSQFIQKSPHKNLGVYITSSYRIQTPQNMIIYCAQPFCEVSGQTEKVEANSVINKKEVCEHGSTMHLQLLQAPPHNTGPINRPPVCFYYRSFSVYNISVELQRGCLSRTCCRDIRVYPLPVCALGILFYQPYSRFQAARSV